MQNMTDHNNTSTGCKEKDLQLFGSEDSDADAFAILALLVIVVFGVAFYLNT